MGILEKIGLKANKEAVTAVKKDGSKVGGSMNQPLQEPPHNDEFKAYTPNFLYKPPFGYPLNKNVLHLKALAKNPYIFSIIRTLKDEASTTRWEIKPKKEFASELFQQPDSPKAKAQNQTMQDQGFVADNPVDAVNITNDIKRISDWFYNPNGNEESFGDIVGQWIQDLCEVDAAVGIKVFNKKGEFSQLFARDGGSFLKNPDIYGYLGNRAEIVQPFTGVVNGSQASAPDRIKIYSSQFSETAAYFQYGWTGNALPVPFGRRELMYICANPRTDSIYGRSPLEVIEEVLLTLVYGTRYNMDFYLNGNMPDGLVNLEGADNDTCNALQERLKGKFKVTDENLGYERRIGHTYPVYGGPKADFISFQLSAKDMEIIEQQKWFTKLVWSAFGVTPDQMGYTEDSNKAVSQTQTGVFKKKALRPLLRKIEYVINTQLMPELDSTGKLEFAFEDYDLDEDTKKATLYKLQIDGGWKTSEMVAEEEGIDMNKLKAHKEEQRQQEMEVAKETNPGFFPEPKPTAKSIPIVKADFLKMPLDELISEHKKLVSVLESDNPEEIKQELEKQKKELEGYISKKTPLKINDVVKIMSGSNAHLGKLGHISKVFNNGEEDYYEVHLNDGVDLLFKENLKIIRNIPTANEVVEDSDTDDKIVTTVKSEPKTKEETVEDYFMDIKQKIVDKLEQ